MPQTDTHVVRAQAGSDVPQISEWISYECRAFTVGPIGGEIDRNGAGFERTMVRGVTILYVNVERSGPFVPARGLVSHDMQFSGTNLHASNESGSVRVPAEFLG